MKTFAITAAWCALVLFASVNSILAMRYLLPHVPFAAPLPNLKLHRIALAIHASCAGIALLIGPFQIVEGFRVRWTKLHRRLGWVYAGAVAPGAISAMPLALHASFGPITGSGFFVLAVLWLFVTGTALWMVIQREFESHRRWMLRSYALTAAAITLRIMLPVSAVIGFPAAPSYRAIAWMCWLLNLVIIEVYLNFRRDSPPLLATKEQG
jgi:uncharacterized membrane protein